MRIALLTDIFTPHVNGVVNHVSLLKEELEAMGHTVWVVAPGTSPEPDGDHVLRYGGVPLGSTGFFAGWPTQPGLWSTLRQVDILHTHSPFLSGALALAARRMGGAPLVMTNHTRYDFYTRMYLPYVPPAIADSPMQAWLRSICDHCAHIIAPSESVAAIMRTWGIRQTIDVVPNGVHLGRFRDVGAVDLAPVGVPAGAVIAMHVGRLSREKSVLALLDAFRAVAAQNSQVHLVVVGEGPQEDELHEAMHNWHLSERVHFAGGVPYDEVPRWFAAADFFVTASTSEVHPLVLVEAAAAGLPVAAVRSPGVNDTVIDGVTGLLGADAGDAFVAAILALAADADGRARMAQAAQKHSAHFDARATAHATCAIYAEALRSQRTPAKVGPPARLARAVAKARKETPRRGPES